MKIIKKIFSYMGPGFITGAADDDPSGIATYTQTGSMFGFAQLWTTLFTFPLMTFVQEMCGRIGLVTGNGIVKIIRTNYSKKILYGTVLLLVVANTINIGADLGAMAAAAQLVVPLPFMFWLVLMVATTLLLEIFITYEKYASYLKYLTFSLFSYVLTVFVIKIDWLQVLKSTLFIHIEYTKEYLLNIVAIFGTNISPYLFFWQANQEVEEIIVHHKRYNGKVDIDKQDIFKLRIDTMTGMFFSNAIMWFIMVTAGATLFANGMHGIRTTTDAALALRPLCGECAFFLFALGIIGTGLLAVPVLAASAAYAVSECFDWSSGLSLKLKQAHGFYGIITISTLVGVLINFIGVDPIRLLYYSAVVNGILAGPLIFVILHIANDKKLMKSYRNNKISNVIIFATAIFMSFSSILLFFN